MSVRFAGPFLAVLSLALALAATPCRAEPLYGHEDDYGIVHLSATPQPGDVLLSQDDASEKLGIFEIKKRIRERGGAPKTRNTAWITEVTRAYGRMAAAPLGPMGFPAVIESGPLLELVRHQSRVQGLAPELVYAVIEQESRFTNGAVSSKGAAGLMQLMPETQATFGVSNPFDPVQNVATGARFLKAMLVRFKDLRLALAAYNAGPETVARAGDVPAIPETVQYVQRILARYAMLQESHPGLLPKGDAAKTAKGKGKARTVAGS
jgi:hypothetical protein